MDELEQLQNNLKYRRAKIPKGTVKLGDAVRQLLDEHISPIQAKYSEVAELWSQLLPSELCRHCEIVDISGGELKVRAVSPAYKYELQLCSSEILEELQQQCPRVRLTKIKFVVS
jgi:hypothetical protein